MRKLGTMRLLRCDVCGHLATAPIDDDATPAHCRGRAMIPTDTHTDTFEFLRRHFSDVTGEPLRAHIDTALREAHFVTERAHLAATFSVGRMLHLVPLRLSVSTLLADDVGIDVLVRGLAPRMTALVERQRACDAARAGR